MTPTEVLKDEGFDRICVLDGAECGVDAPSLVLAFMTYRAQERPEGGAPWIHPYYFTSQRAYQAAQRAARRCGALRSHDEIRVKPIFARLPWLTQGRNTLSYLPETGSRFHVQIFTSDAPLPPTDHLLPAPKPLHCGDCRRCMDLCPTGAIDAAGFHRERCLRNWQMAGQSVPEELRAHMGNRLIGCDTCQCRCPHNPAPEAPSEQGTPPLEELLEDTKAACETLKPMIGANLAIRNRALAQTLLLAGCSGRQDLLPAVEKLTAHPSPAVREHALWAAERLSLFSCEKSPDMV